MKDEEVTAILFTVLLFAAMSGSDDSAFLEVGYRLLLEQLSQLPIVVKYLYSAIFPELVKKYSHMVTKDKVVASLIHQGTQEVAAPRRYFAFHLFTHCKTD